MTELVSVDSELQHAEEKIERATRNAFYEVGKELKHIRKNQLYRNQYDRFEDYCLQRWEWSDRHANRLIAAAEAYDQIRPIGLILPSNESQVRPLLKLEEPKQRTEVWQRVTAVSEETGERITARLVEQEVKKKQEELEKTYITLTEWQALTTDERKRYLVPWASDKTFNQTNENIEWALWTWNPVTGCQHDCEYCYAHDIANRFYPHGFEPTFHPDRLVGPQNTRPSNPATTRSKGVFVSSMADLFGEWVPQEWIDAVLKAVRESPQWNFIFLTKNPERLVDIEWPDNAWIGTTVDIQSRVKPAQEAFRRIRAAVTFLSCEPLLEPLVFDDLSMFKWVIIGGRSQSSRLPAFQPEWRWAFDLTKQAKDADCDVYWKPNLTVRPKEYPV